MSQLKLNLMGYHLFYFLDIERYLLIKLKALLKINLTLHPSLISNQNVFVFCHSHVHQYQQF